MKQILINGLKTLKINANNEQIEKLCKYVDLLEKWNKTYNLTAIKNTVDIIRLHVLDSLTILPFLKGQQHIDIGAGAGLPGIILAIMRPCDKFTLLDSNGKKTRFMTQVKIELGLDNIEIIHSRVEDYRPAQLFDTIITRAFSDLATMIKITGHLLKQNGQFLAMKGTSHTEEIKNIPKNYKVKSIEKLIIPNVTSERHVVIIVYSPGCS